LAAPNSCVAAGPEVAEAVAEIMGVKIEAAEPDIARPGCYFGVEKADTKFIYNGVDDCRAVAMLGGGTKVCTIGCLGLGTCASACPFDAIRMGPDGLPQVIESRCTGCGTCERVCPKHIINLSSVTRRIMREYTSDECTTPCQRACPAGIDIREYIRQISLGNHLRAVQVIKERNPFPAVIGRICPRPCELECRRNHVDEPVAINYLKRYAADVELKSEQRVLPYKAPASGRKLAVVGGGVEGLSTAFFSARLGHEVTLYEATEKLGGLLRSAIARERLPEEILDWDLGGIAAMGVGVEYGKMLGRDFQIADLLDDGFEAVFLATGGWDGRLARDGSVPGEMLIPGTTLLVDFFKDVAGLSANSDVVIAGGGRLALAAAEKCRQNGVGPVTVLVRENRDACKWTDAEVEASGADVVYGASIRRIIGEKDQLAEIETVDAETGDRRTIPARALVLAAGRLPEMIFHYPAVQAEEGTEAPENAVLADAAEAGPGRWEGLLPYKQPFFMDQEGMFGEGDVVSDYSAAIKAIGAGRRGAVSLHQLLYGIGPSLTERVITPESHVQNVDDVEAVAGAQREIMPLRSGTELARGEEVEKGFSEAAALREASRCLQCGLICYNHTAGTESKAVEETTV